MMELKEAIKTLQENLCRNEALETVLNAAKRQLALEQPVQTNAERLATYLPGAKAFGCGVDLSGGTYLCGDSTRELLAAFDALASQKREVTNEDRDAASALDEILTDFRLLKIGYGKRLSHARRVLLGEV